MSKHDKTKQDIQIFSLLKIKKLQHMLQLFLVGDLIYISITKDIVMGV
jgi:hypothetical protein